MKRPYNLFPVFFCLLAQLSLPFSASTQDSAKKDLLVSIGYHNVDNQWTYLSLHAKAKILGKFLPVKGAKLRLYLDKDSAACLAGDLVTDNKGDAFTTLKPSLKEQWNSHPAHTFIAISEGDALYAPSRTETAITPARLKIDTGDGRTIIVSMTEYKEGQWTPVKAADIKVAIKRSGSDLAVSDKESFPTDSTGRITAEFKRDGLPGDPNGGLILIAKVEDNDTYGNLQVERSVPWGSVINHKSIFNDRSLWAARFKTPIWLLFMEYFIFFSVWSVLIYLMFQIGKIKKAGKAAR